MSDLLGVISGYFKSIHFFLSSAKKRETKKISLSDSDNFDRVQFCRGKLPNSNKSNFKET